MTTIEKTGVDRLLMQKVTALEQQVGNTPLYQINKLYSKPNVSIFAKQEWKQIGGSVKARAAYNIIRVAIENGQLFANNILLDATSGNTGIAYASIAKELGVKVALCVPENASAERKQILQSLGAKVIYTSKFEGTDGAQEVARSLAEQHPEKYFYADQYKNNNNWKAHYYTTALEIYNDQPGLTHFVAGLGTTGTFTGTGRRLKELNPHVQLISLQPDLAMHGLEGWKHMETAVVPAIYDASLADKNLEVGTDEAYKIVKQAYEKEGLLLSPSSAANLAGAIKVADTLDRGIIVTILPDNADKYSEIIKQII
ncbi:MAG: cysteine synthase family protein [Bacteroidota bacterium]|nr:cysteine synthase family protein [Bacteroidota bacterium]